jgi:universal stress protein E
MNRFKNILFVVETTVDQASAVARAVSLAERNQADLTIIDVIPSVGGVYYAELMTSHSEALEALIQPYQNRVKIECQILMGTPFLEIIRDVLRNEHDLVIKAAEAPGFMQRIFGSDDMHLLRKCPCPVWLMKPPEKSTYKRILAAVDFDPLNSTSEEKGLNQEILKLASSLALSENASLHLVHAWDVFAEGTMGARAFSNPECLEAYAEREHLLHQNWLYGLGETLRESLREEAYDKLSLHFHLPKGQAKQVIAELAVELQADLVVMGTVARTGISGLIIGNTAEAILDQLPCSVLAIKPPGFQTPVKITE